MLRTNSPKITFEENISNFKKRLIDRGYPQTMIENLLLDIKFTERESALLSDNNKEEKEILPFVTQYQPSASTLKELLMKNWNLIQNQPLLRQIFKEPPIISYKKGKSLKDMLVRAKIQKAYTRFHAGIDVRPVTPCIFSRIFEWTNLINGPQFQQEQARTEQIVCSGAPNENIVQNHLNKALLNVFQYLNGRYKGIFLSPRNFSSVRISQLKVQ